MDISLEKILQMGSPEEHQGNTKNPFENWLAMRPNGLHYENHISSQHQESLENNTETNINGTNSISDVSILLGGLERQTNKFLHLALSSPLIFFAFFAICVTLIILFERKSRRKSQHGKDGHTDTSDNESLGVAESFNVVRQLSEPVLNKLTLEQSFPDCVMTSVSEKNGLNIFHTKLGSAL